MPNLPLDLQIGRVCFPGGPKKSRVGRLKTTARGSAVVKKPRVTSDFCSQMPRMPFGTQNASPVILEETQALVKKASP
jgi:hypothetical protein